jgi:hypothetical protein
MNKTTKTLVISLVGAFALLYLLMPKKAKNGTTSTSGMKYPEPKVADDKALKDKENAVIGLEAMRSAIDNKESKTELNKLSSMIFQDYGVKVMPNKKTGLLRAMSKDGKVLAEEEKV